MGSRREKTRRRCVSNTKRLRRQSAKRDILTYFSAKEKKRKECANDLNDSERQNEIFRMAKQMVKERQDITGLNCIKRASDEKGVKGHGMDGTIRYRLRLRKDQQIASGWPK